MDKPADNPTPPATSATPQAAAAATTPPSATPESTQATPPAPNSNKDTTNTNPPATAANTITPASPQTPPADPTTTPTTNSTPPPAAPKTLKGKIMGLKDKALKSSLKVKLISAGVIVILVIAFVFLATHTLFAKTEKPKSQPAPTSTTQESSQDATSTQPDCVSGYKPFTNKIFSICYPVSMTFKKTQEQATGSAQPTTEYVFEDDVEILTILTDYKDNLNKYNCAGSKVVTVSGLQATRYTIKTAGKSSGCAQTIDRYATLVSTGDGKPVIYVGLAKKNGFYTSDNNEFDTIEQSFTLNQ